jgi:16S rRNA processing protein RimM
VSGDSSHTGDPSNDELVCVGKIVKVRGTEGEVEADLLGGTVLSLPEPLRVFLEKIEGGGAEPFDVIGRKRVGKRLALKLEGVDAPESARKLVGYSVMVPASILPAIPEGRYYHYQIVGLEVVTRDGTSLGRIQEILETGSNDVYAVSYGEEEILIPATDNVVKEIDLDSGRIVVELPPGLVD